MRTCSFPRLAALLGLLFFAIGCGKVTEAPQAGTNTNWLKTCGRSSQCGTGSQCLCGVCTRSCSEDTQCGAVHQETRCQPLSEQACGSSGSREGPACLQGCRSNDDCTIFEYGLCIDGLCVPTESAGPSADGGMSAPPSTGISTSLELTREDATIVIGEGYLQCANDEECTLVQTSCNGCCELGAIQQELGADYEENKVSACDGYRGPQCDCDFEDRIARCVQGRCATGARTVLGCYSPTQNLEITAEVGAYGCACNSAAQSVCVGAIALRCSPDALTGHDAWQVVEDGTCEPGAGETCPGGERRENGRACLAEFRTCYMLSTGDFCGLR